MTSIGSFSKAMIIAAVFAAADCIRAGAGMAASDPVSLFTEYCFEANRLERRSKRPSTERGWHRASPSQRQAFDVAAQPDIELYFKQPEIRDELVALRIHERVLEKGGVHGGETRHSCEIIYSGPQTPEEIHDGIEAFFGAEGYDHQGTLRKRGFEIPPGSHLWCWGNNPDRDSTRWRRKKRWCMFVSRKSFYSSMQLVSIYLKVRQADPPVSVIELEWTYRPREDDQ